MDNLFVEETMAEKVCNKLRDEIISGEIKANRRITVKEICERYGASTMPVRQAFNILCGEKILKNDAFKGATVLGINAEYLLEIYELQSALENFMLQKSFTVGYSDDDLSELLSINEAISKLSNNSPRRIDLNFDFHLLLYKNCKDTLIYDLYCKNYSFIKIARQYYNVTPNRNSKSVEEHSRIIEAIKCGNLCEALKITNEHTLNASASCIESIKEKDNESN